MARKKSPWTIDASKVEHGDDATEIDLIRNGALDRFLELSSGNHRAVLVAGKGQGKTLALLYKAKQYHDRGIKCLPSGHNLIERIPHFHLSGRERKLILSLTKKEAWSLIWEISICAALMHLRNDDIEQDQIFGDLFRAASGARVNSGAIANYALWLIQSINNLEKSRVTLPMARQYAEKIDQVVGVFIDNIDESLEEVCDPDQFSDIGAGLNPTDVWVNAQLGLIDAIDQFRKINNKIKISASIRIEAYRKYPTDRGSNIDEFCEELTYSNKELREIFDLNVKFENHDDLVIPDNSDQILRFFGRESLPHDRINGDGNLPIEENIFECLLRHTLRRPRDLMRIAGHISRFCRPIDRLNDKILRDWIRLGAAEVFEKYKGECFPKWNKSYDSFLDFIPSNVLSRMQLHRIANAFENKFGSTEHPSCYYYQRGLIGSIRNNAQYFLPPNSPIENNNRFPTEEIFFIHPCMTNALIEARVVSEICKSKFSDSILCGDGISILPNIHDLRQARFKFYFRNGEFQFQFDGIPLNLPRGNSQSRLLLAILLRAAHSGGKCELSVIANLDPIARDLSIELNIPIFNITPDQREVGSILWLFQQSKTKSGISPLKQINKELNEFPFCCNNGKFSKIINQEYGKGPITHTTTSNRKDNIVYFDVCMPTEIEEINFKEL